MPGKHDVHTGKELHLPQDLRFGSQRHIYSLVSLSDESDAE